MDFWGTVLVLFRRWYIAFPVFALAVAAAGAVYLAVPTQYVSSAVLVLTSPPNGPTQPGDLKHPVDITNPLLNFDQGLSNTASILVQTLTTAEMADQLGIRPGGDLSYQVTNGSNNPELLINGPFVVITSTSTSAGDTQELVTRVALRARQELVNQQQKLNAPPSTYIVLAEIVPPTRPQAQSGRRLRPTVTALGLGFITSLTSVFAAESILTRPTRRRPGQPLAHAANGTVPAPPVQVLAVPREQDG
jgi:hypothetical protein